MAARTLPQLPAIYQRRAASSRDIAKELGVSVPDWANVRRNRSVGSAHRRLMVEPIIEKVFLDRSAEVLRPARVLLVRQMIATCSASSAQRGSSVLCMSGLWLGLRTDCGATL